MHTDKAQQSSLQHSDLTEKVLGVFYDVYNELGHGFLESVYQRAMVVALHSIGLRVEREVPICVYFRGAAVGDFRADLLVENTLLLELKTAENLDRVHEAQALNYLRATKLELALLLNFGPKPQFRRLLLTNDRKQIRANPWKSVVGSGL
jgi:GxxExxY protein